MPIRHIFWDWNGTLLDDAWLCRDVMNGILPEVEDCEEALEYCWNVRDAYMPPESSGLLDGDDGDI